MAIEKDLKRITARLKVAARRAKRPFRELSAGLGYSPHYLSQLFGGSARLGMELVFRLCNEIRLPPVRLFAEVYGFADLLPDAGTPGDLALSRPVDVKSELRRLADSLYAKVAESDKSQRQLSVLLGEHADYVNQILGERIELKLEHVLRILAVLKIDSATFFAEHFGAYGKAARLALLDQELFPGITRGELFAFFQENTRLAAKSIAKAKGEKGVKPPPKKKKARAARP